MLIYNSLLVIFLILSFSFIKLSASSFILFSFFSFPIHLSAFFFSLVSVILSYFCQIFYFPLLILTCTCLPLLSSLYPLLYQLDLQVEKRSLLLNDDDAFQNSTLSREQHIIKECSCVEGIYFQFIARK